MYASIRFFFLFFLLQCSALHSMVEDNRFVILFPQPPLFRLLSHSAMHIEWFATTASSAFSSSEDTVSIPLISGKFDLNTIATALELNGQRNPLRPDFRGLDLPFQVNGSIHEQGVIFAAAYCPVNHLCVGGSVLALQTNTAFQYRFNQQESHLPFLGPGDVAEIEHSRKEAFEELGIAGDHAGAVGFGDMEFHLSLFNDWKYAFKCRTLSTLATFGVYIPTGMPVMNSRPFMTPFGGFGHWGILGTLEADAEVREDIKAGLRLQVMQRLNKTETRRIPINKEPEIYGAVIGPVEVEEGATVLLSPYVAIEHIRTNLCLGVQYTYRQHFQDYWFDARSLRIPSSTVGEATKKTGWMSEHLTLLGFYDFTKYRGERVDSNMHSLFSFRLDIPVSFFGAFNVPKLFRAVLAFEFAF